MSTNALKNQSTLAEPSVTGSVISRDGTAIGYRQLGHGPGLVVLHGAMESSQSHVQLAEELADGFSVYLPDRCGRGLDRKSTRLNSSHSQISYAVFCLKK